MALSRSKRTTTGQRMTELVGQALEDDETFYTNEIWNDEGSDSENDSYEDDSSEAEQPDVFDSDFNDSEDDVNEEDDEHENKLRKEEASDKRKVDRQDNRYREPTKFLVKRKASTAMDAGGSPKKKFANVAPPRLRSPTRSSLVRSVSNSSILSDSSAARHMRTSTQAKSTDALLARQHALARAASANKARAPREHVRATFTQRELLQEALLTEEESARWIEKQRLDAMAVEQLQQRQGRAHGAGFRRFLSRRGSLPTITFSDYDSMPPILKLRPMTVAPAAAK